MAFEQHGHTHRLDWVDPTIREWDCTVVWSDPAEPAAGIVRGAVDDDRRTTLMRTHSGLHILCGTVFRDFGALVTGGNMQPGEARMDFNLPEVPADFKGRLQ